MNKLNKHRIGILVKNLEQKNFNAELIQSLLNNEFIKIDSIIVNSESQKHNKFFSLLKKYSLKRIIEKLLFKLLIIFEKNVFKISNKKIKFRDLDLNGLGINLIYVKPIIDENKNIYTYTETDIDKIKNRNLDILFRVESGILKGKILNSVKKGIISFHHADNSLYRGLPAGFWEVYNKNPTTGFIIQKLNDDLDYGDILFKGNTITKPYYFLNEQFVYKQSIKYLNKVIINYLKDNNFKFIEKEFQKVKIYKDPELRELFTYIVRTYSLILKKILSNLSGFKEIWNVYYDDNSFKENRLEKFKIIKNFKNRFFADPFLLNFKNKNYIFVEDYDLRKKKGDISCIEASKEGHKFVGKVLSEDFHLSFPFIFKFNNDYFMCPETKEKKEIRLYKCSKFPDQWVYYKTLIKNIYAVDTMLFEKDNIWWMMTNSDKNNLEFSSELLIFYSFDGPLTSNWKEHKKNPIIVDANSARNAGLVYDGKNHFRLNQKIGFNNYGIEFQINKIDKISEDVYEEKFEKKICPTPIKDAIGIHHMNSTNNFSVVDIKRFINKF